MRCLGSSVMTDLVMISPQGTVEGWSALRPFSHDLRAPRYPWHASRVLAVCCFLASILFLVGYS